MLVEKQHGVVTRRQLYDLGLSAHAIEHRLAKGRLHSIGRGVYAVGRPELSQQGRWMAAVLSCGASAVLSHASAAAAWKIRRVTPGPVDVSVPRASYPRRAGIRAHRRTDLPEAMLTQLARIPVTNPALTIVDLAPRLQSGQLERVVNEADKLDLVDPENLRKTLGRLRGRRGVAMLRACLDRDTFSLSDSELERRFLPIARSAGLPKPQTQCRLNGYRVDFFWPHLGLVVETDGLRYHRTAAQQARDRRRDHAHARAGLTTLRFSHAQVRYEPADVLKTLQVVSQQRSHLAE